MTSSPRTLTVLRACTLLLSGTALLSCIGLWGCGAQGSGSPASADSTSSDSSDKSTSQDEASDDEATSDTGSSTGAPRSSRAAARAACASGGCSECGEGACPPGMFCVKSGGGTGCSWFPECGSNADCTCIGKRIGSECRCEEQGQFAHVTCQ